MEGKKHRIAWPVLQLPVVYAYSMGAVFMESYALRLEMLVVMMGWIVIRVVREHSFAPKPQP